MSLTKCPDCRLSFVEAESCPSCARVFGPGELRAQANTEGWAFGRRNNSLFASLFLFALAVLAFVVLRGT
jgi:hypothetical protein